MFSRSWQFGVALTQKSAVKSSRQTRRIFSTIINSLVKTNFPKIQTMDPCTNFFLYLRDEGRNAIRDEMAQRFLFVYINLCILKIYNLKK